MNLSPDDLTAFDQLVDPDSPKNVWNRTDRLATETRNVWIARRTE